jgi:hypothetical protein
MPNPWAFSESRPIAPFRMSSDALSKVGFRSRQDVDFNAAEPFHMVLEPTEIRSPDFAPEIELAIDRRAFADESGIEEEDAVVSVLMSDPGMLRAAQVAQWPLKSAPKKFALPRSLLEKASGVRGLLFRVCASPRKPLKPSGGRATTPGQVVAAKDFAIEVPADASGFPIDTYPSDFFVQHRYPADTVWVIHWKTIAEFDRPIEDCLSVWFNSDHASRLMRLGSSDKLGNVLWTELAIEICLEIALVVFASDPSEPANQNGLLAKIMGKLQTDPPMTLAELCRKARVDSEGVGFFRSRLQAAFGQGKKIQAIPLAGRT